MCTPIDFKYLVICTGYENRYISNPEYMDILSTKKGFPKISSIIFEGKVCRGTETPISKFIIDQQLEKYYDSSVIYKEVEKSMNLWTFFHIVYQSDTNGTSDFYCRSLGISSMMYNKDLEALFIRLNAESGSW